MATPPLVFVAGTWQLDTPYSEISGWAPVLRREELPQAAREPPPAPGSPPPCPGRACVPGPAPAQDRGRAPSALLGHLLGRCLCEIRCSRHNLTNRNLNQNEVGRPGRELSHPLLITGPKRKSLVIAPSSLSSFLFLGLASGSPLGCRSKTAILCCSLINPVLLEKSLSLC